MDGYVRFGPRSDVVCLGEGAETVASVHAVMPSWRCLAACSSIRIVDQDPDLARCPKRSCCSPNAASRIRCATLVIELPQPTPTLTVSLAHIPAEVVGDKADMNDVLQTSPALVRHALSTRSA